jgi:hypothetical protein
MENGAIASGSSRRVHPRLYPNLRLGHLAAQVHPKSSMEPCPLSKEVRRCRAIRVGVFAVELARRDEAVRVVEGWNAIPLVGRPRTRSRPESLRGRSARLLRGRVLFHSTARLCLDTLLQPLLPGHGIRALPNGPCAKAGLQLKPLPCRQCLSSPGGQRLRSRRWAKQLRRCRHSRPLMERRSRSSHRP